MVEIISRNVKNEIVEHGEPLNPGLILIRGQKRSPKTPFLQLGIGSYPNGAKTNLMDFEVLAEVLPELSKQWPNKAKSTKIRSDNYRILQRDPASNEVIGSKFIKLPNKDELQEVWQHLPPHERRRLRDLVRDSLNVPEHQREMFDAIFIADKVI